VKGSFSEVELARMEYHFSKWEVVLFQIYFSKMWN